MRGIFSMRWVLWLRRGAVAFVLHCSPLSRALCNMESSSEGFSKKVSIVNREKWTPLVGHISSFVKWLTQLMLRIFAYRSRPHQE